MRFNMFSVLEISQYLPMLNKMFSKLINISVWFSTEILKFTTKEKHNWSQNSTMYCMRWEGDMECKNSQVKSKVERNM